MTLYVQETGPTDAPTIVLLHGAGVAGWMYQPQLADLAREYHCLVPDLPGHGQSPDVDLFTLTDCAAQIADLIRGRAHGGQAHVVGLSMGSSIAMLLLAEHPELINHTILSGPAGGPMPRPLAWLLQALIPLARTGFMVRLSARQLKITPEAYTAFAQSQRRLTGNFFNQIAAALADFAVPAQLSQLHKPVLVAVGQKEASMNYAMARKALSTLPDVTGVVAPGVGHGWNMENPDLFNRMIRAWIIDAPLPVELLPLS